MNTFNTLKDMEKYSDKELEDMIQNGDTSAFDAMYHYHLYGKLKEKLSAVFAKEIVEDALQEAYTRAKKKLHTYQGISTFEAWFYTITKNNIRSVKRTQAVHPTCSISSNDVDESILNESLLENASYPTFEEALQVMDLPDIANLLSAALDTLTPQQKGVLIDYIGHKHTAAEVAKSYNIAEATVRTCAHYALKKLALTHPHLKDLL